MKHAPTYDIVYDTTPTELKYKTDFECRLPYLARTGKLWGVFLYVYCKLDVEWATMEWHGNYVG